jgi:glycosyltransferase involved in cell wall biosynthesis
MAPGQRIALLHYSAPPVVGGVENVLAQHARMLADHGHTVTIVAARGEAWDPRIPLSRVPLADSRHPRVLAAKAALDAGRVPPDFAPLVEELVAALRTALAGAGLLIAHNVCSLNKNLALTAALRRLHDEPDAPRLVLWHHDLAWTTPRYRGELHDGYPWDLLRTAWPGARQVVVSAWRRAELAELLALPAEAIQVVPNGVDAGHFLKLEPQTRALVAALALQDAAPLLLLPVRLTPRKNIELALRVTAALRREWPATALLVTGPEGPHNPANAAYRERLLALRAELGLQRAAHFLAEQVPGFVPDAVVADCFRLADALLLPSREEGFGIPLVEAAFSRLPVFCSDIPPLRELGGDDVTYFAPDADPAATAALIRTRLGGDRVYGFAVRARTALAWDRIYARHIEPLLAETDT